jgi:tetratricopeptide (TPR) repeat protein
VVRLVFRERLLAAIAGTVMLVLLFLPAALCHGGDVGEASYHNQRGMEYFEKGFCDHMPKKQVADAERNYGFAIREFRAAISRDTSFTDAHRNLARVYYVQKNFQGAAEEYRAVTELVPGDLDAYINRALALVELKRLGEAIQTLEDAKQRTPDPKARDTLDGYIAKAKALQVEGVR